MLPTCTGQRRGNARGDPEERGRANGFQQETAEEAVILVMEQNNTFHKTIAKLGGLLTKWLTVEEPAGPCRVLRNTVQALQKVGRGMVRVVCCF